VLRQNAVREQSGRLNSRIRRTGSELRRARQYSRDFHPEKISLICFSSKGKSVKAGGAFIAAEESGGEGLSFGWSLLSNHVKDVHLPRKPPK